MHFSKRRAADELKCRDLARDDFLNWAKVVMEADGVTPSRHQIRLIDELMRLENGDERRLMLLLPPGSAKSTYASILFPPWWLARHRKSSIITACHTSQLATHFGRKVRGLLQSHGAKLGLQLREDSHAADRFATVQGGEFFAIGVHGAVTGRRADLALIDDPIRSSEEAASPAARDRLFDWFRSDLVTRLKPRARIVLIMSRLHTDDLAGRLLEQGGWRALRYPALAEVDDELGRSPGEALWPEWEDRDAILEKRLTLGEPTFAAMFQQAPLAEGGLMFDISKIEPVSVVPPGKMVRGWDLASKAAVSADPDWTAGVRLLRDEHNGFVVDDVVRLRADPMSVQARIVEIAHEDGKDVVIGLPQDPGQAGVWQIQSLTRALAGFDVRPGVEQGTKENRAAPVAAQVSAGNLRVRRAAWTKDFLDELAAFPRGRKDDQVDALSRAFHLMVEVRPRARRASISLTAR